MRALAWPRLLAAVAMVVVALYAPNTASAVDADVVPPIGAPGTTFTFFALGFKPNERVSYWLNTPGGTTLGRPNYVTVAGETGRADWTWVAPSDAALGQWTMVAYGQASGAQQTVGFQVGDASAVPPSETQPIAMNPVGGAPGTMLTFYATGFDDREIVGFWATAPNHSVLGNRAYRVRANRDGRADWSWRIPEAAQPGVWTMTAQGDDSKVTRTIRFEVR